MKMQRNMLLFKHYQCKKIKLTRQKEEGEMTVLDQGSMNTT